VRDGGGEWLSESCSYYFIIDEGLGGKGKGDELVKTFKTSLYS